MIIIMIIVIMLIMIIIIAHKEHTYMCLQANNWYIKKIVSGGARGSGSQNRLCVTSLNFHRQSLEEVHERINK